MKFDDLDKPLGYAPPSRARGGAPARDVAWGAWALGGMALLAASLVAFVYVTDGALPPTPVRLAAPQEQVTPRRIAVSDRPVSAASDAEAISAHGGVRIISPSGEQESGVKIIRRNGADGGEAIVIRVPQEMRRAALTPAPDARLVTAGPYGPLPRMARDGTRPMDVYASPRSSMSALSSAAPRLALVVTGLGGDASASLQAGRGLPAAVTFAFVSTSVQLDDQAEQARLLGHEVLLQVPMEGYEPRDELGVRPLLSNVVRDKNLDALHWHMSRFAGYIGLTHVQGARVLASASALTPILQDVAERGLLFFDDGSARQALTSAVALATGAPSLRADINLDAAGKLDQQDESLRTLEALARDKGSAIGAVRVSAQTIDRLSRFAKGLEARGIALVPLSALAPVPARTVAR